MDMKLKNLVVKYNACNYADYDGTPPQSYSAKITLETKMGETTTILEENDIIAILGVVCHRVSENMKAIAQTTAGDIERAASGNLLEHEVN